MLMVHKRVVVVIDNTQSVSSTIHALNVNSFVRGTRLK